MLLVSNLWPPAVRGGYELLAAGVADALAAAGHDVHVLTTRAPGVAAAPRVARALTFEHPGPRDTLLAPVHAAAGARAARRALAAVRPDAVFIWNGSDIPQAALRALESAGVPVLYSVAERWFADLYTSDRFLRHLRGGERGAARRAWGALARAANRLPGLRVETQKPVPVAVAWISAALRAQTPAPPTARVVLDRVIPAGTRREADLRDVGRAPAPDPLVAFLGRLEPQKGPELAVEALARLREEHGVLARLVCAGAAPPGEAAKLRARAREQGVEVELRGMLDGAGLARLLGEAHVLVVPSTWDEPYGLVCLEGAIARVPVVAAAVGGIPEILRDDEEALLFPRADAGACAAALARTLQEPEATAARVARAAVRAEELSWERYCVRMEQFVRDAVEVLRS